MKRLLRVLIVVMLLTCCLSACTGRKSPSASSFDIATSSNVGSGVISSLEDVSNSQTSESVSSSEGASSVQSIFVPSTSQENFSVSISSIITGTSTSSSVTNSSSSVSVSSAPSLFTITIKNEVGGTVTANKVTASVGENIVLEVTLDNPRYYLISLKFNGQDITGAKSFIMPNSNVEITVVYGYNPHWTEEA